MYEEYERRRSTYIRFTLLRLLVAELLEFKLCPFIFERRSIFETTTLAKIIFLVVERIWRTQLVQLRATACMYMLYDLYSIWHANDLR